MLFAPKDMSFGAKVIISYFAIRSIYDADRKFNKNLYSKNLHLILRAVKRLPIANFPCKE